MTTRIDELIAASSIGEGLRDIAERGIDAHLADLEQEAAPAKKRRKGTSPTARTLAECRRRGWRAGVVERHLPFPKPQGTKIDLFGIIDVVALSFTVPSGRGILGIQATSATNHSHRREKILASEDARDWVTHNGRLEIWSWSKRGRRWQVRVEAFTVESWGTP